MISQINTEILISTSLEHPNIIKVYDCFEEENYIYMVLELAENGQLYQKLRGVGRFDEATVRTMIRDVVAAV
jgi:calcium-dependent protein kinase